MSDKKVIMTYDGYKTLEAELQDLKVNRRKDVAEKLKEARGQGDLSENAEYDAAKEEQAEIEAKIVELESKLKNAEIIDDDKISKDKVTLGCRVKILDVEEDEELEYVIVGSTESDPTKNKISNESPVGGALIGHKKGDEILVSIQGETIKYKLLDIL